MAADGFHDAGLASFLFPSSTRNDSFSRHSNILASLVGLVSFPIVGFLLFGGGLECDSGLLDSDDVRCGVCRPALASSSSSRFLLASHPGIPAGVLGDNGVDAHGSILSAPCKGYGEGLEKHGSEAVWSLCKAAGMYTDGPTVPARCRTVGMGIVP